MESGREGHVIAIRVDGSRDASIDFKAVNRGSILRISSLEGTANNTYTGLTTIENIGVGLNSPGHVAISGNVQLNSGGALFIFADQQIASTATFTDNGLFHFSSNSGNITQTIGTLNGSGAVVNDQNNTATLVVGAGNFSGQLLDGNGPVALTKQGRGTLILSGANGYSSATTINGGTLEVDGSTGSSSVTVNSGGALAGSGTVGGTVTVNAGGFLTPGTSTTPGTLTTGTLVLTTGATSTFRIGGAASDMVAVHGNFTLTGNLSLIGAPGLAPGTFTLFTFTGSNFNFGFDNVTGLAGFSTSYSSSNFIGGGGDVSLFVDYLGTPQYWDGTHTTANGNIDGGSGTWNATSKNWTDSTGSTNSAWQSGTAIFSGPGGTVTLGGPISVEALFFNSTGYTLKASTLKLVGPAPAIDVVNAGTKTTIASAIAGTAGLAATGGGTLILTSNANTYTGATSVTNGTLQLGTVAKPAKINATGAISIGNGGMLSLVNVANNTLANSVSNGVIGLGLLSVNSPKDNTLSGALTDGTVGQLALIQGGAGTTTLTNSGNTYSGRTIITGGTLQVGTSTLAGSIGASSTVFIDGSTLALVKVSGGVLANNISSNEIGGTGLLKVNSAGNLTLSGNLAEIAGTLVLTQSGAGTTTLTGIDTYSGATTITAGKLQIGDGAHGSIGNTVITVSGTGVLALDLPTPLNGSATFANTVNLNGTGTSLQAIQTGFTVFSGVISGTGAFDQGAAGNTRFTVDEKYTGPTNVTAGILEVDGSLASNVVHVGTNAELDLVGTVSGDATLNGGFIQASGGQIKGTLAVTGGLWGGSGTVVKAVTSSAGTFTLDLGANLTATAGLNVTGGTLADFGADKLTGSLNYTSSSSSTFAGVIADGANPSTLTMNHAGPTLTLTGSSTYTGATTITAGTLDLANGSSIASSSPVTIGTAGTLTVGIAGGPEMSFANAVTDNGHFIATDGNGAPFSISNIITGTGNFTKTGGNFVSLFGANTYKGGTVISGGILAVDNGTGSGTGSGTVAVNEGGTLAGFGTITGATKLNFEGVIAPSAAPAGGSPVLRTLHLGALTWNGGGDIKLELGAGGVSDALALSGALTKGTAGSFDLIIEDDGMTSTPSNYTLLTFTSTNFKLSDFNPVLPEGVTGTLVETSTSLMLENAEEAPDVVSNPSDVADSADLTGATGSTNLTEASGSAPDRLVAAPLGAPEPGSAMLLSLGGITLLGWRRRRSA